MWPRSINTIYKYIASALIGAFILASNACHGGGSSTTGQALSQAKINSNFSIGEVATVPILANTTNQYVYVAINNNFANKLNLQPSTEVYSADGLINKTVDFNGCKFIAAHSTCNLKLAVPKKSGSYLLSIAARAEDGQFYKANQLINFQDYLSPDEWIYLTNLPKIIANGEVKSITVPFITTVDMQHLSASGDGVINSAIYCNGLSSNVKVGDLCSLVLRVDTTKLTEVILSSSNSHLMSKALQMTTSSSNGANLLLAPSIISIAQADGNHAESITIINNGSQAVVGNITVNANSPLIVTNNCPANLAAGAQCNLLVNVASPQNVFGQQYFTLSYNTGFGIESSAYNVNYIPVFTNAPGLTITATQTQLYNVGKNQNVFSIITITNVGQVGLTDLSYPNPPLYGSTAFSWDSSYSAADKCVAGEALVLNQSCTLRLKYTPESDYTTGGPGVLIFNPAVNFMNNSGQLQTYSYAYLAINYNIQPVFISGLQQSNTLQSSITATSMAINSSQVFVGGSTKNILYSNMAGNAGDYYFTAYSLNGESQFGLQVGCTTGNNAYPTQLKAMVATESLLVISGNVQCKLPGVTESISPIYNIFATVYNINNNYSRLITIESGYLGYSNSINNSLAFDESANIIYMAGYDNGPFRLYNQGPFNDPFLNSTYCSESATQPGLSDCYDLILSKYDATNGNLLCAVESGIKLSPMVDPITSVNKPTFSQIKLPLNKNDKQLYTTGSILSNFPVAFYSGAPTANGAIFISRYPTDNCSTTAWQYNAFLQIAPNESAGVMTSASLALSPVESALYVVGTISNGTISPWGNTPIGTTDYYLVKYPNNFSTISTASCGIRAGVAGESAVATSVNAATDNTVYVYGYTTGSLYGAKMGLRDYFIARYDNNCNLISRLQYGASGGSLVSTASILNPLDNSVFVTGQAQNAALFGGSAYSNAYYFAKYK